MARLTLTKVLRLAAVNVLTGCVIAGSAPEYASGTPLEQFKFRREGAFVTLPVSVEGTRYNFILDTGTSHTCYSTKLRQHLGDARGRGTATTAVATADFLLYDPPFARVGRLPLHLPKEPVCCVDLQDLSRNMGTPISGVVGMAFLRQFIVALDFDGGTVSLLRQLPDVKRANYTRVEITMNRNGCPMVTCHVADARHTMLIDTGAESSGHLELPLVARLYQDKSIVKSGATLVSGAAGEELFHLLRCRRFSMGGFEHPDIVFTAKVRPTPTDSSKIGLRYLRRFNLLLDFPRGNMYLRKSKDYSFQDHSHCYGMQIGMPGKLRVLHVYDGSPAQELGIEKGDEVISIDGTSTARLSYLEALGRIGVRHKPLQLELLRNNNPFTVRFPLDMGPTARSSPYNDRR